MMIRVSKRDIDETFRLIEAEETSVIVEEIVEKADQTGDESKIMSIVNKIWDKIKDKVYRFYFGQSDNYGQAAKEIVSEVGIDSEGAGYGGNIIESAILEKVRRYEHQLLKSAIYHSIPEDIGPAEKQMSLKSINLGIEVSVSGNIEASLTSLFKMSAGGKIKVDVNYAR